MTEFDVTLRHHCRNAKCHSKLPAPIASERKAFCCRGWPPLFVKRLSAS
jgi:hypothetical protein